MPLSFWLFMAQPFIYGAAIVYRTRNYKVDPPMSKWSHWGMSIFLGAGLFGVIVWILVAYIAATGGVSD
jgi:hypothetical protein